MARKPSGDKTLNQPLGANAMPRFGGPWTMMRLPQQQTADGLDACFIGVPLDIGTSNRSGCRGPNLVGCDLVEVSPPYDPSGNTALMAANLLFEMLSVLPGAVYH